MPGVHAKLAPSAAKRWSVCTASPGYIAALTEAGIIKGDKESIYSLEGTEAHEWASRLLLGNITLDEIPDNFRPHIMEYERVCLECEHEAGEDSLRMVESKVPLFYSPEETGTVDYGFMRVMGKSGKLDGLYVRDLKYGAGVPVDAEENKQLAIYGHSWITELETWWGTIPPHIPVSIGIHQPRYHGDDPLKLWETTVGELNDFCNDLGNVAFLIQSAAEGKQSAIDALVFAPSADVCQFCPAKGVCKARMDATFEDFPVHVEALDMFSNLDAPAVESIPVEQLVAIWRHRKDITKWLDNAGEYLTALAAAGNPAPGTKLVMGREGNRAWKDEVATEKVLKKYLKPDELWKRTLISPAKAEVILKAELGKAATEAHMTKLTERPAGKEVLTTEDDKREAVMAAVDHFSVLTDESEDA